MASRLLSLRCPLLGADHPRTTLGCVAQDMASRGPTSVSVKTLDGKVAATFILPAAVCGERSPRSQRKTAGGSGPALMCEICGAVGATFGMAHDGKRRWCTSCKPSGAGSLMNSKMCEDCSGKRANYGIPTEDGGAAVKRWCAKCSRAHAGSKCLIRRRMCEDCVTKRAVVGVAGSHKRWCARCSKMHSESDPPPPTPPCKLCEDCGINQRSEIPICRPPPTA